MTKLERDVWVAAFAAASARVTLGFPESLAFDAVQELRKATARGIDMHRGEPGVSQMLREVLASSAEGENG